jgi:lipid II:glycine glycyltransferase (peptidoglycan interpeptide bridge formation enzyme)
MTWDSPYQTRGFHQALLASGFNSSEIRSKNGSFYFSNWMSKSLTAWEVDELICPLSPKKVRFFKYKGVVSEILCKESYYTLIMQLDSNYKSSYSKGCRRNILKAKKNGFTIRKISRKDTLENLDIYLILFKSNENLRGLLNWLEFKLLISNLIINNSADIFICTDKNAKIAAVAITIISKTVANLRFTTYDMDMQLFRPMNIMIDDIASYYHKKLFSVLDLSGFDAHSETDKMIGVNRFKMSFSQTIVQFENSKSLCIQL